MSRMFTTFLIGVLVSFLSLCVIAVASLGSGLADFLSEMPLFRFFVELDENIIGYETGNPVVNFELDKSVLIFSVLVVTVCLVKSLVNRVMKAFVPHRTYEKILMSLNKFIWSFVISMICVPSFSTVTKSILINIKDKTSDTVSVIIAFTIALTLIIIAMLFSSFARTQRAGIIIIRIIVIPVIQIVTISAIFSFIFCAFKSDRYILLGALSLASIAFYIILERVRNELARTTIVSKKA